MNSLPAIIMILFIGSDKQFEEQIDCLALNVYHEARSESIEGQKAVASVTINRMISKKYPSLICDVVWQDRQFSWTQDGKSDKPYEYETYLKIRKMLKKFLLSWADNTKGALYYHNHKVKPYWASTFRKTVTIGNHTFYRRK